jgi:hypothetical protein
MIHILRKLDQHRCLGFPIWEFSFRSLPRLYGRIFAREIVLRHPLRTLQGMLAYRQFSRQGRQEGGVTHLYAGTEADLRDEIVEVDGGFLVALGFCQKPLGTPDVGCPAGHFNHECHVLARDDILEVRVGRLPIACHDCDVRVIGTAALRAGATVYIMTSAADIARHLFVPTLESDRFQHGLFLQCSYSIPAMILPLLICRIRAMLVGYSKGDCQDYGQFLQADEGIKDERTHLNPTAHAHVLDFLQGVASARQARGQCRRFHWDGFLYVPTTLRHHHRA